MCESGTLCITYINDSPNCRNPPACVNNKCTFTTEFKCPETEWIDCIPPYYDRNKRVYCVGEYFDWMNENCNVSFAY